MTDDPDPSSPSLALAGLQARLVRPRLPPDHIVRPRLLRLLDGGLDRRLTLVSAPAGFGKTTLISAWTPAGYDVAWLSVDKSDADLWIFAWSIVAALQRIGPGLAAATVSLLNLGQRLSAETLAAHLAADLASAPRGVIVVLDDVHTVRGGETGPFLAVLLGRLPSNAHLVISTREDPPLPLDTLRARAELHEIRLEQLAFTHDEGRAFLANAMPPSSGETSDRLMARTEGWPAGLRLAALAVAEAHQSAVVPVDSEERGAQYAREFLIDDVFAAQPPEIQTLLLRASILDRVCAPLLDALSDEADQPARGQTWLAALQQSNLFLTALDNDGVWWRFHQLFRDALQRRLRARATAEEIAALHRRASDWLAGQTLVRAAIRHALAGGDAQHAAELVEQHVHPSLDREDDPAAWLAGFAWYRPSWSRSGRG